MVSELSDDAPERETVVNRIISRSKETVTKLTTIQTTLKEKKTKLTTEKTDMLKDMKDMTEKLTKLQGKIVTKQESLKLKIAERKSKRQILISYGDKTGEKTPTTEGAIITQGAIDKITKEIKDLRKDIKKEIQTKNESFSTKVTTQKQIDLIINNVKTINVQLKNIKDFISEVENTIEIIETRIKEEIATKKVIETQKEAFKAAQKKTDAEEQLNSTRVVTE
jgi:chromosome segregation ATPase